MTKKPVDPVKAYLSRIGRKGGQSTSAKKGQAARVNIQRALAAKQRLTQPTEDSE